MKKHIQFVSVLFILSILNSFVSCTDNSDPSIDKSVITDELIVGSGFFAYSDYLPFDNKTIKTYYYIPISVTNNTPIVFVFHGNGRNAKDYRDAMIAKANQYHFIVIAPTFSITDFPGGNAYNLGNVFIDGDNPTTLTLNPEDQWTFSVIEPLFDFVKKITNNSSSKYHVFGHSAGGQFAHRFVMFKPHARIDKVVTSGSGWYTMPNKSINFPYGFKKSPLETMDLSNLFKNKLIIQIGELDNDPNAASLRHNEFADAQGLNRVDRAKYFFKEGALLSEDNNLEFNWELFINKGEEHDYKAASESAADLIFN